MRSPLASLTALFVLGAVIGMAGSALLTDQIDHAYLAPALPKIHLAAQSSKQAASAKSAPGVLASAANLGIIRQKVLELVNRERASAGLVALKQNATLERAAQLHADDMVKRKFFSHKNPGGKTPEDRIRLSGYFTPPCPCKIRYSFAENIAKGQKTAEQVMSDWMQSAIHRENILRADIRELGVGFAGGLWVQNFGSMEVLR